MSYTADFLIEKRKAKWEELQNIEYDKQLREAIANDTFPEFRGRFLENYRG